MQPSSRRHHQLLPVLPPSCTGLDPARAHQWVHTCADVVAASSRRDVEEPSPPPGVAPFPSMPHYYDHDHDHDHDHYTEHREGCCPPQQPEDVDLDQEWNEILQQLTDLSAPSSPLLPSATTATATTDTTSAPSSPTSNTAFFTATMGPSASAGSSWNSATTTSSSTPITIAPTSTTTTAGGGGDTSIDLCHKPRGSGGVWFPLEQDQPLRVTKGMGKRLRVAVHSRRPFAWEELTLTLVDLATGRTCPEMLTFPHKSTLKEELDGSTRAEMEVKIERLCSRLCIRVAIAAAPSGGGGGGGGGGWTWEGRSRSFLTHNNGNIGRKRKTPPAKHQRRGRPGHAADSNKSCTQ